MEPGNTGNAVTELFGRSLRGLRTRGYVDWAPRRDFSAEDLRREIRAVQGLVDSAGLAPGDVVAVWTEPSSAFVINYLAGLSRGLVVVPLDAHQPAHERARRVALVGAHALLAGTASSAAPDGASAAGIPVLREHPGPVGQAPSPRYPTDAAMVLFTSGSTGPSKAAVITHRGLIENALATAEWQQCTEDDLIAGTISMSHCFAILHTVLAPFLAGAGVVGLAPFSPSKTLAAAREFPLTILPGTPAMFELLLAQPAVSDVDWRLLRCGCSGGALLRPETQQRFLKVTDAPLLNGYGITEATSFVACPLIDERDQAPLSMGHPVRGVRCRIHQPSSADGAGELEVGGASVMACYLGDPVATRRVITDDGWLRTGDRVRITSDGELFYVGRIKNIINRGGENIHPELVEAALAGARSARRIVAVGVPDPILGERIAAVVECRLEEFDESALRTRAAAVLAKHERPDWYIRVDRLPTTATGKVSLAEVREFATQARARTPAN